MTKIRVMLVDDSAVIRGLYDRALKEDGSFEVVASASNGQMAISFLKKIEVDVLILDIEMPVMDGITALPELLAISPKTRVIMASTLTTRNAEISIKAMDLGAADYLAKPSSRESAEVKQFYAELITKIKALAPRHKTAAMPAAGAGATKDTTAYSKDYGLSSGVPIPATPVQQLVQPKRAEALAIASSTGGPQALLHVFREFKGAKLRTPIFITQHMPANFTAILATHISSACGFDCHEAKDGELVEAGKIYVAPGDYHMTTWRDGSTVRLKLDQSPPVNFCRPSADPMFRSLMKIYGDKLLAAVLTGLGADGARGASEIVSSGGTVVAQDEETSIVYGMPKAVADAKLTSAILPLSNVAGYLMKAVC